MGNAWLGIIADTLGRPLEVLDAPQDAAALGAAAIAFVGLGRGRSLERSREHVRVARVIEPDPARTAPVRRGVQPVPVAARGARPVMRSTRCQCEDMAAA